MTYQEHFLKVFPEEGCGYLKDGVFFPCDNIAEDKLHSFEIDSSILLLEPDVILHSHPITGKLDHDPHSPSEADLAGQIATDVEWGICVTDGEVCEEPMCWGNPDHRPELLDRQFIHNIQDCFTLTQDWFYKTHNIVLPNLARSPFWFETSNLIEENYTKWGFSEVNFEDILPGDVLVFTVRSNVPNHLGIYLGNGEMLSHWVNRLSGIQTIGIWQKYITKIVRYSESSQNVD
jgi:proteasome lid subunit RPN8/RPN11